MVTMKPAVGRQLSCDSIELTHPVTSKVESTLEYLYENLDGVRERIADCFCWRHRVPASVLAMAASFEIEGLKTLQGAASNRLPRRQGWRCRAKSPSRGMTTHGTEEEKHVNYDLQHDPNARPKIDSRRVASSGSLGDPGRPGTADAQTAEITDLRVSRPSVIPFEKHLTQYSSINRPCATLKARGPYCPTPPQVHRCLRVYQRNPERSAAVSQAEALCRQFVY